jgi:hypothetical protein
VKSRHADISKMSPAGLMVKLLKAGYEEEAVSEIDRDQLIESLRPSI